MYWIHRIRDETVYRVMIMTFIYLHKNKVVDKVDKQSNSFHTKVSHSWIHYLAEASWNRNRAHQCFMNTILTNWISNIMRNNKAINRYNARDAKSLGNIITWGLESCLPSLRGRITPLGLLSWEWCSAELSGLTTMVYTKRDLKNQKGTCAMKNKDRNRIGISPFPYTF